MWWRIAERLCLTVIYRVLLIPGGEGRTELDLWSSAGCSIAGLACPCGIWCFHCSFWIRPRKIHELFLSFFLFLHLTPSKQGWNEKAIKPGHSVFHGVCTILGERQTRSYLPISFSQNLTWRSTWVFCWIGCLVFSLFSIPRFLKASLASVWALVPQSQGFCLGVYLKAYSDGALWMWFYSIFLS